VRWQWDLAWSPLAVGMDVSKLCALCTVACGGGSGGVYILVGGLQLSLNLQISTWSLELFQRKALHQRWKKRFGTYTINGRFGGALRRNGLAQHVTRGSWFEALNGHLASKHVQLAVQLCTRTCAGSRVVYI
jgi:hypothetical protein